MGAAALAASESVTAETFQLKGVTSKRVRERLPLKLEAQNREGPNRIESTYQPQPPTRERWRLPSSQLVKGLE
jgi:hypothetical protein